MSQPFRLYNTLSRAVEDFQPLCPGEVGLYVCGMTVYDHAHLGHARAMVIFDAFVRNLRYRGWKVRFVRNFTDIDDKIIHRAAQTGEAPLDLAQRFIDAFHHETAALGLSRPDAEPRVSTSLDAIVGMIQGLVDEGHAYLSEGTVWFSVASCPGYGRLSGQQIDQVQNPDAMEGKRSPADFALWKGAKEGEPSWPSPWGPGRPGWHIECSAMSKEELGATFDIHGGGLDLVFPHHENEVAQSECANHAPFARYWMHNGLLVLPGGGKMSKSVLGTVFRIEAALEHYPAEAIRLYLLMNHYRSPTLWTSRSLDEAQAQVLRLYEAKEAAQQLEGAKRDQAPSAAELAAAAAALGADGQALLEAANAYPGRLATALAEDFNTALGLAHTFDLARAINRAAVHKKARKAGWALGHLARSALQEITHALGFLSEEPEAFHEELRTKGCRARGLERSAIEALVTERTAARAAKDWARSDALRDQLAAQGISLLDGAEGSTWRFRADADRPQGEA